MGELVALETQNMEGECKNNPEDNSVDFVAATTAALGVPSPSLSRGISFDDSPRSVSDHQKVGKGDMEEEAELFRALKLSEVEIPTSLDGYLAIDTNGESSAASTSEGKYCTPLDIMGAIDGNSGGGNQNLHLPEPPVSNDSNASSIEYKASFETLPAEAVSLTSKIDEGNLVNQPSSADSAVCFQSIDVENTSTDMLVKKDSEGCTHYDVVQKAGVDTLVHNEIALSNCHGRDPIFIVENHGTFSGGNELCLDQSTSTSEINEPIGNQTGVDRVELSSISPPNADSYSSSGRSHLEPDAFTSSVDGSEPMYEGEECMLDSGITVYEEREPMYEGEVILAEQADKGTLDASNVRNSKVELTPYQGKLCSLFHMKEVFLMNLLSMFLNFSEYIFFSFNLFQGNLSGTF